MEFVTVNSSNHMTAAVWLAVQQGRLPAGTPVAVAPCDALYLRRGMCHNQCIMLCGCCAPHFPAHLWAAGVIEVKVGAVGEVHAPEGHLWRWWHSRKGIVAHSGSHGSARVGSGDAHDGDAVREGGLLTLSGRLRVLMPSEGDTILATGLSKGSISDMAATNLTNPTTHLHGLPLELNRVVALL